MKVATRIGAGERKLKISNARRAESSRSPAPLPHSILRLQRTVGNQAVQSLLMPGIMRPKAGSVYVVQARARRPQGAGARKRGTTSSPSGILSWLLNLLVTLSVVPIIQAFRFLGSIFPPSQNIKTFIKALNQQIKRSFGKTSSLKFTDFRFLGPLQFVRHRLVRTQSEYREAKARSAKICKATGKALKGFCLQEGYKKGRRLRECLTLYQQVQGDKKFCKPNKAPTDLFIATNLRLSGVTPRRGPSLVSTLQPNKAQKLETVVHEGLHRLAGKVWQTRSWASTGTTWRHSRTRRRLARIKDKLDEGVVQILTKKIMRKMKRWFGNYASTNYSSEVSYVMNILRKKNKRVGFLVKAYFADRSTNEVEDLQSWQ